MGKESLAAKVVGNIATGPIKFYVQKKAVPPMLAAIKGSQPNQFSPPLKGLADRDDSSGKFARQLGQNRRSLETIAEMMQDERMVLVKRHAERYPEIEIVDGAERPHPLAGQFTPVYANDPKTGAPLFRKDRAGNDTDERIVNPDEYNLGDPLAFQKDMKDLLDEWVVVECPGITADQIDTFKGIAARIIDPLLDIQVNGLRTARPEQQIEALRNTAKMYLELAEKMERDPDAEQRTPVTESVEDDDTEDERSAP